MSEVSNVGTWIVNVELVKPGCIIIGVLNKSGAKSRSEAKTNPNVSKIARNVATEARKEVSAVL